MTIFGHNNVATYLRSVLDQRTMRQESYSLRAFAKDLELSPAYLSQLMSRKKKLSPARRLEVARRLGLGAVEGRYFYLLAQQETAPSPDVRAAVQRLLDELARSFHEETLDTESFRAISDWYHIAILEMTFLDDFQTDPEWIAGRLGIDAPRVRDALDRLQRLGLLIQRADDGHYVKSEANARYVSSHTHDAFAHFMRQMLELAAEAVDNQPLGERVMMTQTFCIEASQLAEAREITRDYVMKMAALFDRAEKKDHTYQLNVQFFNLTDGRPKHDQE